MIHTVEQNEQDFKKIIESGVLVHGLGQFGRAIVTVLRKKMDKIGIKDEKITVIEKSAVFMIKKDLLKAAIEIARDDRGKLRRLLEPFFTEESIKKMKKDSNDLEFVEELNIISESEPNIKTREEEAIANNKIHILAVPSGVVDKKLNDIDKYNTNEERIIVNLAKGKKAEEILERKDVVAVSGPCYASQIWEEEPTGANVAGWENTKVDEIMKAFYSDQFRPYKHKNLEAVFKGGVYKNILAFYAGFLTDGLNNKKKAEIISALFMKMLDWGEKDSGIPIEDLIDLSGIGDFYLCMNDKSRNFNAGIRANSLSNVRSFDDFKNKILVNLPSNKKTVEGLDSIEELLNSKDYRDDDLISAFRFNEDDSIDDIRENLTSKLLENQENSKVIDGKKKASIKFMAFLVKDLVNKLEFKGNTEALLLCRGLKEILEMYEIETDNLSKVDIGEILKIFMDVSLNKRFVLFKKIINKINKIEDLIIENKRGPILSAIIKSKKDNFKEETLKELTDSLMKRPIKL